MADNRNRNRRASRLRLEMRELWSSLNLPCYLCGQPIDYDAPRHDPEALEADHVLPVSGYPDLEFEPSNLRPTHSRCNRHRGPGRTVASLGATSERW